MSKRTLPYFDVLLLELEKRGSHVAKGFGKHVHWGYWKNPITAKYTHDDFYAAAENLTKEMCTLGNISNHQSVLDVGCGFGGTISFMNDQYSDMVLTGVNIDGRQLQRANKLIKNAAPNPINFIEADACKLPFPNNYVDNVLAVECIFHFPSRKLFFQEASRVLKPGGSITLSDFIPHPLLLPSCWLMPLFKSVSFFGACNLNYTLRSYRKLAEEHGLEMEAVDITKNVLPTYYYLGHLNNHIHLALPYRIMAAPFLWAMRFLSKTSLLTYQILSFKKPHDRLLDN